MRFRWLDESVGTRIVADASGITPGADTAESDKPRLTSCAELDEGVIGADGAAEAVPRSDCHMCTRRNEFS